MAAVAAVIACLSGLSSDVRSFDLSELARQAGLAADGPVPSLGGPVAVQRTDNGVDPATYPIGPGDVFYVSLVGYPSEHYTVSIDQKGNLYIPQIGLLSLQGATLQDAEALIQSFFREKMRREGGVYVALVQVKDVSVSVTGVVSEPGTHVIPGNSRLIDAVRRANGGQLPDVRESNLREVMVRSASGGVDTVDVLAAVFTGDDSKNPYLAVDTRITVLPASRRVLLAGQIKSPLVGFVPIRSGESLRGVLSLVTLMASADTGRILYQREGDLNAVDTVGLGASSDVILSDGDVIVIPSKADYHRTSVVNVGGEVARPGSYPIERGRTTMAEVVAMAGGPTDLASPQRAFLVRADASRPSGQGASSPLGHGRSLIEESASVRPQISVGLRNAFWLGDYVAIQPGAGQDTLLVQSGDWIEVPRRDPFVYVSGAVANPGAYAYNENSRRDSYIKSAGGYSRRADRANVTVARRYRGNLQLREADDIEEGDIIVVPESEQFRRWNIFKDAIVIIGGIASTILVIFSIATM